MKMLDKSSTVKLKSIKWALEKFFYSAGTNIAFYNASKNKRYKSFQRNSQRAIIKQIEPFYDEENVKAIQDRVPPRIQKIDDIIIDVIVSALFVSFADIFTGGAEKMDEFLIWAGNIG